MALKITCLSSSVRIEQFRDLNLNLWKSTDDLWKIVDVRWNVVVGRYVRFFSYVNWYFSGLDDKSIIPMRILRKRCSCTQIWHRLRSWVVQRQTYWEKSRSLITKKGNIYLNRYVYSTYLFVKNVFDSVEVGISETDGSQVNFKDGQTILTINFRGSGSGSSEISWRSRFFRQNRSDGEFDANER